MRFRDRLRAVWQAIRRPETYAPPPLPTSPPEPPVTPRQDREVSRPPRSQVNQTRYIPRSDLPESWGPSKAGLWQDATKSHNRLGRDENAQRFYDAALYTFSEDKEQRATNLKNFKQYVRDYYGINWDAIFDWAGYRRDYDESGVSV